jgi:thiamine pyrophosphate-dependent acetolactate synthase large subunit-like protein
MPENVTVAEAVGRTIALLGATQAFGVVGSGNFHVTNAMIEGGVRFVATRHEMGAACMADAYSRATHQVAIVSVHQGCGLTNSLTGVGEAVKAHSRVLVVSGDSPVGEVTSNFFIDQDAAVEAIGAVAARVHSAASAVADTVRAYQHALLERATVVLSLPIDLQLEQTTWDPSMIPSTPERIAPGASADAVTRLVHALTAASRPVIVGGRGAWDAGDELRRLGRASGAIMTTSAGGRGLFAEEEWALDIMGGFSTAGATEIVADADLIVVFGAALNRWTTRGGELLLGKTVIHVDDDPTAIGLHYPVALGIVGDSRTVAAAAADAMTGTREGYRTPELAERIGRVRYWSDQPVDSRAESDRVDPRELTNRLDAMLPMARIVVPDGGNFNCYPAAHLRVPDQFGYCLPQSFQSIGLALSSAIGAATALPDRLPIAAVGDGGFLMSLVELDTAVRLKMGLLVVVYNDSAYGAEVHHFEHETDELETVVFPETDLAAIARGYGCEAATIRTLDDLDAVTTWLAGPRDRPMVLDAKVAKFASWVLAHVHQTA